MDALSSASGTPFGTLSVTLNAPFLKVHVSALGEKNIQRHENGQDEIKLHGYRRGCEQGIPYGGPADDYLKPHYEYLAYHILTLFPMTGLISVTNLGCFFAVIPNDMAVRLGV